MSRYRTFDRKDGSLGLGVNSGPLRDLTTFIKCSPSAESREIFIKLVRLANLALEQQSNEADK